MYFFDTVTGSTIEGITRTRGGSGDEAPSDGEPSMCSKSFKTSALQRTAYASRSYAKIFKQRGTRHVRSTTRNINTCNSILTLMPLK
jgi:hypothetical protein